MAGTLLAWAGGGGRGYGGGEGEGPLQKGTSGSPGSALWSPTHVSEKRLVLLCPSLKATSFESPLSRPPHWSPQVHLALGTTSPATRPLITACQAQVCLHHIPGTRGRVFFLL